MCPELHIIAIKSSLHSDADNAQLASIVPAFFTPLVTVSVAEVPTTITGNSYNARGMFNHPIIRLIYPKPNITVIWATVLSIPILRPPVRTLA
jgi:hypothetical protein